MLFEFYSNQDIRPLLEYLFTYGISYRIEFPDDKISLTVIADFDTFQRVIRFCMRANLPYIQYQEN